jgi:putative nucleotidyltransferase with HDIG domain
MSTLALDDVVKDLRQLPSLPAVVVDILGSFDDANADVGLLADKVARDQALTAKTLRLANSSFYGLARHVTTLHQAITVLGFNGVRTLIAAIAISGSFPKAAPGPFNLEEFWRHSVATALVAKTLARHAHLNQDFAFIAGLLHDIGSLVLATRFPEHYREVLDYRRANDCHQIEAECAVLGIEHTTVGLALADYWRFPSAMRDAIAHHHDLRDDASVDIPALVHVAEAIAHALDVNGSEDELVPPLSDTAWHALNLDGATFDAMCRHTEIEFDKACQILRA